MLVAWEAKLDDRFGVFVDGPLLAEANVKALA